MPINIIDIKDEIMKRSYLPALGGYGVMEQDPIELASFVKFLLENDVKKYLEIGVSRGGLLSFMTEFVGLEGYGLNLFEPDSCRKDLVFLGDCHGKPSIDFAKSKSNFDLVFIDANHSYESIDLDYKIYNPMASKFVAFHDICGLRECDGAKKHWEEISKSNKSVEFINPLNPVGIGLIFK